MDVLGLLESKRRCLSRYLELSERYLASTATDGLSLLESFEHQRDRILKALGMYDRKISAVIQGLPSEERNSELADSVRSRLNDEAPIIQAILMVDNQIIQQIEREKENIRRQIVANHKSRDLNNRFKSAWVPTSGEELDHKA